MNKGHTFPPAPLSFLGLFWGRGGFFLEPPLGSKTLEFFVFHCLIETLDFDCRLFLAKGKYYPFANFVLLFYNIDVREVLMNQKKLRRIFLTWNNWQKDFETKEQAFNYFKELSHIKAFIIGFEIGEQGTHHIQGVFQFTQPKYFHVLREYFKNNHIEQIHDLKSAIEYCKKDNDFLVFGEITKQGQRTDIEEFTHAIIDGYTDMELLTEFPVQTQRYLNNIEKIRQMVLAEYYQKNLRHNLKVVFISGNPGVGKTRYIYERHSINDIYRVTHYENPFDNYKMQKILVLDEYNNQLNVQLLLNILDIYPLLLPARYTDKWACYEQVYVISNYDFDDLFGIYDESIYQAIRRRFNLITERMTFSNVNEIYKILDDFNFNNDELDIEKILTKV